MRKSSLCLIFALVFYLPVGWAGENPHEINQQTPSDSCLLCHATLPKKPFVSKDRQIIVPNMADYKADGVGMCAMCHDPNRAKHMLGRKIEIPLPKELPLTEDKKIVCLTCHYAHGDFYSEQPRTNITFFDKLFNTQRMHNSFLLRLNNTDGQFCLLCHQSKQD